MCLGKVGLAVTAVNSKRLELVGLTSSQAPFYFTSLIAHTLILGAMRRGEEILFAWCLFASLLTFALRESDQLEIA